MNKIKTFKEYINEGLKGFELKDLIKILTTEGYNQYKNKEMTKMHEYTNGNIIISMGTSNNGKSMDIFRIRTDDKKDGSKFIPKDLKHFTSIIRNRSKDKALQIAGEK